MLTMTLLVKFLHSSTQPLQIMPRPPPSTDYEETSSHIIYVHIIENILLLMLTLFICLLLQVLLLRERFPSMALIIRILILLSETISTVKPYRDSVRKPEKKCTKNANNARTQLTKDFWTFMEISTMPTSGSRQPSAELPRVFQMEMLTSAISTLKEGQVS